LITHVLEEAREPTGTWSLATHQRVLESLNGFRSGDFDPFFAEIIERFLSPDATMGERFKLAQLCTMCHQKVGAKCDPLFLRWRESLLQMADSHREDPLGPAVSKLIASLFTPPHPADRRASPAPMIVPSVTLGKITSKKRVASSLTPVPS
jgi:hypothetical protein